MPSNLTVDDSSTIRSIINKTLGELGFEFEQAEDGQQGLAKLEELSVDLILLDVTMPVMDGPTMLEKLRGAGNRTPVVMLTSEAKRSIIDLSKMPMHNDKLPRLVLDMDAEAKKFGIALRIVGQPEAKKALRQLVETASLPFFATVNEAKAA